MVTLAETTTIRNKWVKTQETNAEFNVRYFIYSDNLVELCIEKKNGRHGRMIEFYLQPEASAEYQIEKQFYKATRKDYVIKPLKASNERNQI